MSPPVPFPSLSNINMHQQHANANILNTSGVPFVLSDLSPTPPPPPPPRLPGPPSYLHPEELELLKPTLVPSSAAGKQAPGAGGTADSSAASATKDKAAADAAAAAEEKVTLVPSSKKEAAVRRRELLAYLREPLREACASNAGELMRSKFAGALVLLETVRVSGLTLSSVVLSRVCFVVPSRFWLRLYLTESGRVLCACLHLELPWFCFGSLRVPLLPDKDAQFM